MKSKNSPNSGALRRLCFLCGLTAVFASQPLASAQDISVQQPASHRDELVTTAAYVTTFYPLWFTFYQRQVASVNRLVGPTNVTALYQIVVAINDDTLYASTFFDLTEPVILTIPTTVASYSVLTLDAFGNVFESGIPSHHPTDLPLPTTTYALYGPDFTGTAPPGVTAIVMPVNYGTVIFRADKFSPSGQDQQTIANQFRASLFTQPLCAYLGNVCPSGIPPGGQALILPEAAFSEPFKTVADALIARDGIEFLRQLQVAVHGAPTPRLSAASQALSDHFDDLFADQNNLNGNGKIDDFIAGAKAAHGLILGNYLTHTGPNNWIHFTNMGKWGRNVLDRASITEFIQYGNDISAAAYYHTFKDGDGRALNGRRRHLRRRSKPPIYVLTFAAPGQNGSQVPPAERFWSLTAYTPESIELIDNPANKYVVASYTPGLQYNADGSLSIYMATKQPAGVPMANWLPIPRRKFNIMLRVYGVVSGSNVAENTYVPPAIEKIR
jgi:hypothetical protein